MFYATQIESLTPNGAIDVHGRTLQFIGYLPVEAGDTVYTDGNVIFGNAPPKGAPPTVYEQGGIPVLCDEDASGESELRGYFTQGGKFKSYRIKGNDWIVNDKKNYTHDEGSDIIDAEIGEDGSVYTATDGFYRKCQAVKYSNHLFQWFHGTNIPNLADSTVPYLVHAGVYDFVGEEITLGAEADDINTPVSIYKNGKKVVEFSLKEYATLAEEAALRCSGELMKKSADITQTTGLPQQDVPENYFKQPPPPSEPFVALTYARIETFRINPQGDWDAIIFASAYGYCFPYILLDGSVFEATFNDEVGAEKTFSEDLVNCVDIAELLAELDHSFLTFTPYPPFDGEEKVNGEYTEAYKRYIESKLEYYIPLFRFKHYQWEPVHFDSSFYFHVHNGEIVTVMAAHSGGGDRIEIIRDWSETAINRTYIDFGIPETLESNDWKFPLGDNYFLVGRGFDPKYFCLNDQKIFDFANLPYSNDWATRDYPALVNRPSHVDSVAVRRAASGEAPLSHYWHRTIYDFYSYTAKNMIDNYLKVSDKEIYYPIRVHVSSDSDDGFFRLNPSCLKVRDGYLLGYHSFKANSRYCGLYKIDANGRRAAVGNDFKNFRLRELKKINKSKR